MEAQINADPCGISLPLVQPDQSVIDAPFGNLVNVLVHKFYKEKKHEKYDRNVDYLVIIENMSSKVERKS